MRRRVVVTGVVLLLLSGFVVLTWTLLDLPPVRFILRYGLAPGCEPTGHRKTVEGVEFVEIGPGIFRMGSDHLAKGGNWLGKLCEPLGLPWGARPEPSNEMPVHWVEFRDGFWIAKTEVTYVLYERFAPKHERSDYSEGDHHPVVEVSWDHANAYCSWLSKESGLPVRLPSEAEWECACRAGTESEFSFGDDPEELAGHAWYWANSSPRAQAVATRRPNPWGLHDFHGNVMEWCEDEYRSYREDAPNQERDLARGGTSGSAVHRIFRGGNTTSPAESCRSARRNGLLQDTRSGIVGFRPAFSLPTD